MSSRRFFSWVPNTLTSCNLLFGAAATVAALEGRAYPALLLMIAAAVCDFFDGFAARLLHAPSAIGKELDSLADVISFGLAPAALLFHHFGQVPCPLPQAEGLWRIFTYFPFVLAAFSALRLAKFNLDSRQSEVFLGLPTPACALYVASWAVMVQIHPFGRQGHDLWLVPTLVILLSWLLVSEIPMLSFKIKHWTYADNKARILFLGLALCMVIFTVLLHLPAVVGLFLCLTVYILIGLISNIIQKVRMRLSKRPSGR